MTDVKLARARLVAQGLVVQRWADPADAVSAFGAMQGQDLPGALASAALRTGGDLGSVLSALDQGRLVRGYPMRGTVFLMAAQDVVWVSQLCNAGALRAAEKRRGQLGLSDVMVERAAEVAREALESCDAGLSRAELFALWRAAGTPTDQGRGYHVLAHLVGRTELVYGPWNGTDQNVVLSSRWLPAGTSLAQRFNEDRVAAVAELLPRYLSSHGPATLRDFAWWTKLPLREIRAAWALIADRFELGEGSDPQIWRPGLREEVAALSSDLGKAMLLPGFDEFILGYADRLFAMTPEQHALLVPGNNGVFGRSVVVGGLVRGLWKRAGRSGRRTLEVTAFEPLSATVSKQVQQRFEAFPFATA